MSTFYVTNTNDHGPGSLRDAIAQANSTPGTDQIQFKGDTFKDTTPDTITLTSGQLVIEDAVSIEGPGAENLIISGNNNSRVLRVDDGDTNTLVEVNIQGLTIANGKSSSTGGGITNQENLVIEDSVVRNNESVGFGAGIFNGGRLRLTRSTVSDNTIRNFPSSGGFFTSGGGIANATDSNLFIESSTISGNNANRGGGIINSGLLGVANSTISGNQGAARGGGIFNTSGGTVILNSSTITNNKANIQRSVLLAEDTGGGGIYTLGEVSMANTIVAENMDEGFTAGESSPDLSGDVGTARFNLIGDATGSTGLVDGVWGNQVGTSSAPIDPMLGDLQDNGGPTLTHAPLPGSPVLNAADPLIFIPEDQRGVTRPFRSMDIGAVEGSLRSVSIQPTDAQPFKGSSQGDRIIGSAKSDRINSGRETDVVFGGAGDDRISGQGGDDFLFGEEGNDILWGEAKDDVLNGGAGSDRLFGQNDNDTLVGGRDRDLLEGGRGYDELSGGAGADIFQFNRNDFQGGVFRDTILDFNGAEGDRLRFVGIGRNNISVVNAENGRDLELRVSLGSASGRVTLRGVTEDTFDIDQNAVFNAKRVGCCSPLPSV